jgi:pyruvate/2-oxoglutarate dehydrogenase complex dihydrolipoamide dehydrogenase (E3) component
VTQSYDVIVVGMGVGGEEVAGRAASAGLSVLAVENRLVGGECPYWACIPTKGMVRAGDALAEAARAKGLAGDGSIQGDWEPVAQRMRTLTDSWNDRAAVERIEGQGMRFVRGTAHLTGERTLEIDGDSFLATRALVIATGSEPAVPPIDGLDSVEFWTNREAVEATEVPGSLVILGAGAVGLEFAQVFRRFGADVTIVESNDLPLHREEPENSEALAKVLASEGIVFRSGVRAESVSSNDGVISVVLDTGQTVTGDRLLVATGRRSNLEALGVAAAGLDATKKAIEVDDRLKAAEGLYAVGDVTGKGGFTHVAVHQGRVAAAHILGQDGPAADYSAVPRVTFTDPEIASVGLTERQARAQGIDVRVGVAETAASSRGYVHGPGAEHGVMKLVADRRAGVLVGASVMSPAAGEVLGLLVLAVRARVPVPVLRSLIYPYPTFVRGLEGALAQLD